MKASGMAAPADMIIRNGTVIDGTGARDRFVGDVAIRGGKIVAVGAAAKAMTAEQEHDATGMLVTPGWVDCHTHYDAQIGWDPTMSPSCWHGVTSVVFGNCGVTFAPCWPDDHDFLVELMEGVEDIPGTALHDGISWQWTSFPEFLDFLETLPACMDFAPQIGHAAVRSFVIGERSVDPAAEPTDVELQAMADVVQEAVEAGAAGFSSTFAEIHMDVHGNNVPGCFATEREVLAMAKAANRAGYAVYETAGGVGNNVGMRHMLDIAKEVVVTFTCIEAGMAKTVEWLEKVNTAETRIIGQVFARCITRNSN